MLFCGKQTKLKQKNKQTRKQVYQDRKHLRNLSNENYETNQETHLIESPLGVSSESNK